jgi:catechol 2,3-dioxygenase-like lactoylglutathione lyase family enzyme
MSRILRSVNSVRIFTRDLERARRFYADVLELHEQATGAGFVVFDLNGVDIILEFHRCGRSGRSGARRPASHGVVPGG